MNGLKAYSSQEETMIFVLLGPPGAGKGTQAAALVKRLGVIHVSTGDIFRSNLAAGTPLGLEAKGYMESGVLVPDELVLRLVGDRLSQPDASKGALLDGFPRTGVQAEGLEAILAEMGRKVRVCLLLEVPDQELIGRLAGRRVCRGCGASWHISYSPPPADLKCNLCGGEIYQRADDSEAAINQRLTVYHQLTSPLVQWYASKGLLKRVDGVGDPARVEADLAKALES
jgi:adenylate kinase